uniref:Uncharacterized protein n=1 Tax=Arundo donax TaxID=35708 RepID=A0A0A9HLM2_ARUDO
MHVGDATVKQELSVLFLSFNTYIYFIVVKAILLHKFRHSSLISN